MCRDEFPRIFELRDLLPTPLPERVAFPSLDEASIQFAPKRKFLRDVEAELQGLDAAAWAAVKAKLTPLPKKHKTRVLEPLYNLLNEAKAYNYLSRIGCTNIHFIPESKTKGQKTPDLGADAQGRKVLCDVKTINRSDVEVHRANSGGVGTTAAQLDAGFFRKLTSDLEHAKTQMLAYDPASAVRKIVYVVVNYDDNLHECGDSYWNQIAQFTSDNPIPDLEVEFDIKPPFYSATGVEANITTPDAATCGCGASDPPVGRSGAKANANGTSRRAISSRNWGKPDATRRARG